MYSLTAFFARITQIRYSFCVYTAMQNEHKVVRLEHVTMLVLVSYLMDSMSPEKVVPHLVKRRLLTHDAAVEVLRMHVQVPGIVDRIEKHMKVGMLSTLCAALFSAGQSNVAERLLNSKLCLPLPITYIYTVH